MRPLNVFSFGYYSWHYPKNWFSNIKQFFVNIKYAFQRATKGYCSYDIWDLDAFHTQWMIDAVSEFRKSNQGYPASLTEESWNAILDEIVLHFTNFRDVEEVHPNIYEEDFSRMMDTRRENGFDEKTGCYYTRTRDEDFTEEDKKLKQLYFDAVKEQQKWARSELEQGMKLFTKWYQDIWW